MQRSKPKLIGFDRCPRLRFGLPRPFSQLNVSFGAVRTANLRVPVETTANSHRTRHIMAVASEKPRDEAFAFLRGLPPSRILASLCPSSLANGSVRRVVGRQWKNSGLTLPSLGIQRRSRGQISAEFATETAAISRRRSQGGNHHTGWLGRLDSNRHIPEIQPPNEP